MAAIDSIGVGNITIYQVDADPTVSGVAANIGDLAILQDGSNNGIWLKGSGGDTSWDAINGEYSDGGEARGKNRILGNTDNFDLTFITNNTPRMVVTDDGKIIFKHPSNSDSDIIFDMADPVFGGFSISKPGTSGFFNMMPNSTNLQWLGASPTAPVGTNRWFLDVDNGGDMYIQTLPGAGASGELIATDGAPLRPDNDATSDLGRSDKRWKDFYAESGSFRKLSGQAAIEIDSDDSIAGINLRAGSNLWGIYADNSPNELYIGTNNGTGIGEQFIIALDHIDAKSKPIRNVTDPTAAQHAATKNYVDTRPISNATDVDTTGAVKGDLLLFNGTNWVPTKYGRVHCMASGNIGSASNAANQNFQLDLSDCNFEIGDTVRIGNAYVRGDLSGTNEYLDVGIGSTGDPKARLGKQGYGDLPIFRTDGSMIDRTYVVVDIGGGTPGLQIYVSPSAAVNFSPSGMPNGWWWQLKIDVLVV